MWLTFPVPGGFSGLQRSVPESEKLSIRMQLRQGGLTQYVLRETTHQVYMFFRAGQSIIDVITEVLQAVKLTEAHSRYCRRVVLFITLDMINRRQSFSQNLSD